MKNNLNLRGTLRAYDWLKDIKYAPDDDDIVLVNFKNTRTGYYRNTEHLRLQKGDWVTVEAAPGHDIGRVMLTGPLVRLRMRKSPAKNTDLKRIFRLSSPSDMETFEMARAREHDTMIRSRQIANDLSLEMKIGDVEYQGDGMKAIFYYIADERVDFRKLIRILADTFKIRVEMKQIGARQEAGRIGGIGPCGRPLCCSTWLSKFVSVGTGSARIQDLSMNPQKLAGQCAKLKCCLNFETDTYAEASRELPPKDVTLLTADSEYFQFKVDILSRAITYSTDKHLAANIVTIPAERALEIIELNKKGIKPETLEREKAPAETPKEYVELVGQDSVTRFDKSKRAKKEQQRNEDSGRRNQRNQRHNQQQSQPQSQQQSQPQSQQQNQQKRQNQQRRDERNQRNQAARQPSPKPQAHMRRQRDNSAGKKPQRRQQRPRDNGNQDS